MTKKHENNYMVIGLKLTKQFHKCVQFARCQRIQNISYSTVMLISRKEIVLRNKLRKYCMQKESLQSVTLI